MLICLRTTGPRGKYFKSFNKFSQLCLKEMCRGKSGEFVCGYWVKKGHRTVKWMHCHRIIFLYIYIYIFILLLIFCSILFLLKIVGITQKFESSVLIIIMYVIPMFVVKMLIDSVEHQEIVRSMFATVELPKAMYVSHGVAFFISIN